jgi:hypothetical protein
MERGRFNIQLFDLRLKVTFFIDPGDFLNNNSRDIKYIDLKLSLFTNLCNATGVFRRTIPWDKKKAFQKNAMGIVAGLIEKVDSNRLKNKDIRDAIIKLSIQSGFGKNIGAAQKVINVYLKYYCVVAGKDDNLLKELDCPIDSWVRQFYKLHNLNLKDMEMEDYEKMQRTLQDKCDMRFLADIDPYDKRKVKEW